MPGPLDDLLARFEALNASVGAPTAHDMAASQEIPEKAPDPVARLTVKAVRGSLRDAPVERCVAFPPCPRPGPCFCPPVDVEAFQRKWEGTKRSDAPLASRPTMLRGPEFDEQGDPGHKPTRKALLEERDPELMLDPLPVLEPLPPLLERPESREFDPQRDRPSSTGATKADQHHLCKRAQSALRIKHDRTEHKLKQALAEVERLRARVAELEGPKKPKKGQSKRK